MMLDHRIYVGASVSVNTMKDLLLWNQSLYRRVNTGTYQSVSCELEFQYSSPSGIFDISASHAYQGVLSVSENSDRKYVEQLMADTNKTWFRADTASNGALTYTPIADSTLPGEIDMSGISQQISLDGKNFLNLSPNVTKLAFDFHPAGFLTLHVDSRIFWGLPGRSELIPDSLSGRFLGIEKSPIVKANAVISFFPVREHTWCSGAHSDIREIGIQLFLHNFLAPYAPDNTFFSRNSIRWQQMSSSTDLDLYAEDVLNIALRLNLSF